MKLNSIHWKNNIDLNNRLLILGCGGHSKVVTEVAESIGFNNIVYLDLFYKDRFFFDRKVYQSINEDFNDYFFVAIGDNFSRERLYKKFLQTNPRAKPLALLHPNSFISLRCLIGEGSIVMPLCAVNSCTEIGKGVIINTQASLDHDCKIDDFSSIAPGSSIGGQVQIGYRSAISIGAKVRHNIKIGNDVLIGASSLVLENATDNSIYYGVPAKYIRNRQVDEKYL